MISYVKRKALDTKKYDACIESAINSRIYAFSWYLDCVADNWDVLVYNNYQAVMPLPWREKYFIKYVYLTPWTQQLGVFSVKPFNNELIKTFLAEIPKKFKLVEQFLNSYTKIEVEARANYILDLQNSYKSLHNNFSKGRKSDIKRAQKSNLAIKLSDDATKIIDLFKIEKAVNLNLKESDYQILEELTQIAFKKGKVKMLEAYLNTEFIGAAIFLIDDKRITYLFSALNKKGREFSVMSLLISNVIKEYSNSHYVFDFEGSTLTNIASFFKSFGAVKEEYFHYKKYRF